MEENEMESKLIKLTRFSSSCDNILFDTCAFIHFWIFLAWPRQNAKFWLKVVAGTITPDMSLAGDIATGDRHFNRTFNLSRPEGSAQPSPSPLIGVCFFLSFRVYSELEAGTALFYGLAKPGFRSAAL
jgi:hypothetical protein